MKSCPQKKNRFPQKNWISLLNSAGIKQKSSVNPTYNNLYAYSGNNPIKYTDPDGRKLFVSGTKEYMAKVQQELSKLCPGARINFDTGEVTLTGSSSNTHPKGYELLSSLITSEESNTIWIGDSKSSGNSCVGYTAQICMIRGSFYAIVNNEQPQNSLINFNPDDWVGGYDDNGSCVRPPYVGLAHEMGHSEAHNNGTQEHGVYIGGKYQPSGYTPFFEKNSIKWENEIRNENKWTLRTYYYPVKNIFEEQ